MNSADRHVDQRPETLGGEIDERVEEGEDQRRVAQPAQRPDAVGASPGDHRRQRHPERQRRADEQDRRRDAHPVEPQRDVAVLVEVAAQRDAQRTEQHAREGAGTISQPTTGTQRGLRKKSGISRGTQRCSG